MGDEEGARTYDSSIGVVSSNDPTSVGPQPRQFRVWHDSTGSHQQDAALVDYNGGIIHLSSSDGTLLEIPEGKLSPEDLNYVKSLYGHKRAQRKVFSFFLSFESAFISRNSYLLQHSVR